VPNRPPDGCWQWPGGCNSGRNGGYGELALGGQKVRAHRLSWSLAHGAIPDGLFVCHRCDNPRCVRPDHLFLGTSAENLRDMASKGRHWRQKTRMPTGDSHASSPRGEGVAPRTRPDRLEVYSAFPWWAGSDEPAWPAPCPRPEPLDLGAPIEAQRAVVARQLDLSPAPA
jgi:hypothetical protein